MISWLRRWWVLAALAALPVTVIVAAAANICEYDASAVKTTLRITNLCEGFVMWKTGPNEFVLVCPGSQPPAGATELREFFNFKVWGS